MWVVKETRYNNSRKLFRKCEIICIVFSEKCCLIWKMCRHWNKVQAYGIRLSINVLRRKTLCLKYQLAVVTWTSIPHSVLPHSVTSLEFPHIHTHAYLEVEKKRQNWHKRHLALAMPQNEPCAKRVGRRTSLFPFEL